MCKYICPECGSAEELVCFICWRDSVNGRCPIERCDCGAKRIDSFYWRK